MFHFEGSPAVKYEKASSRDAMKTLATIRACPFQKPFPRFFYLVQDHSRWSKLLVQKINKTYLWVRLVDNTNIGSIRHFSLMAILT